MHSFDNLLEVLKLSLHHIPATQGKAAWLGVLIENFPIFPSIYLSGIASFAPFLPETSILVYFGGHLVAKTMALARLRAGRLNSLGQSYHCANTPLLSQPYSAHFPICPRPFTQALLARVSGCMDPVRNEPNIISAREGGKETRLFRRRVHCRPACPLALPSMRITSSWLTDLYRMYPHVIFIHT